MSLIKKARFFSSWLLINFQRNKLFLILVIVFTVLIKYVDYFVERHFDRVVLNDHIIAELSSEATKESVYKPAITEDALVEQPVMLKEETVMSTLVVQDAIPVSKPTPVIPVKKKPGTPLKKVTHAKRIQRKQRAKNTFVTLAKHKINQAKATSIPIPKKSSTSTSAKTAAVAEPPVHAMTTLPSLTELHQTVVDDNNIKPEASFHEPKNDVKSINGHFDVSKNGLYDAIEPISSTPDLANQGIYKKDKYGYTPLHSAVEQGNTEIVWEWLYQGIPVNAVSNSGYTPLHLAAKHGHIAIIKLLLMKDANLNIRAKNGNTALDLAIAYDQSNVVNYFLKHYNNKVLHYTNQGRSILHVSARHNSKEIIHMLLLDKHFSVDKLDNLDQTPLHIAAKYGRLEALKALLFFNANLNAQATGGYTPLHLAIQYNQYEVVQELLSKGADAKIITNLKETPLSLAERLGRKEMYALLIKYLIIS